MEETADEGELFNNEPNKRIDYVLVYRTNPKQEDFVDKVMASGYSPQDKEKYRQTFQENLKIAGLELEGENGQDDEFCYVKLSVKWPTLKRIATLLGLPKKIKLSEVQDNEVGSHNFTAKFDINMLKIFDLSSESNKEGSNLFTPSERSIICKEILDWTYFNSKRFGISKLLKELVYEAAYPLHDGPITPRPGMEGNDRQRLYEEWVRPGRALSYQPLDLIRKYLGEKVGMYFAWLGFYTMMLIPASLAGLAVFIYGLVTLFDDVPSSDICDGSMGDTVMCPLCDKRCSFWYLEASCLYSRITHVFDNFATVAFACFMSVWATIFTEMWYRKQKRLQYDWGVDNYEAEERIRPDFEYKVKDKTKNPLTQEEEPFLSRSEQFCRKFTSFSVVLFWLCLVIAAIISVVIFRIVVAALIYSVEPDEDFVSLGTTISASLISLVLITILNQLYARIAVALTEMELPRTWTDYEDSLTTKMFLFQFVNYYGSIFYIAFFKGRFSHIPGVKEGYLFGKWRQDTCDASGCMVDLFVQLAIIMIGKQLLNNIQEIIITWLKKLCKTYDGSKTTRWEKDHDLPEQPQPRLFAEYLEMVIQFGFVTIFVTAFPLAPFFALLNNIIEIRLDACKFIVLWRREPSTKAQDIGAWYGILQGISFVAVISNAFIIGYTSDFVPKLFYRHTLGDGNMTNYLNYSLSVQRVSRFDPDTLPDNYGINVTDDICRYRGYIEDSDEYNFSEQYWQIFTVRLAFVIAFEHAVFILTWLVSYLIPDVPHSVKQMMLHEKTVLREKRFRSTMQDTIKALSGVKDGLDGQYNNADGQSQSEPPSEADAGEDQGSHLYPTLSSN